MQSTEILTLESVQIPNFQEAYDALLPTIVPLPVPSGCPTDVAVPSMVARILRAWPLLAAHRSRLVCEQPLFELNAFDRLKQYALALGHAHSLHMTAAATLADCLATPEQARILFRYLATKSALSSRYLTPHTALELAGAIAERLSVCDDPIMSCRALRLIDQLETFPERCAHAQERFFETDHHRNVLLGLVVATYDRARIAVLALHHGDPALATELPELLDPQT